MSRSRRLVAFVSGVLALILAILWWQQRTAVQGPGGLAQGPSAATSTAAPATSRGTSPASRPADQTSPSSAASLPEGCATQATAMTPARMTIPSMDLDTQVLSLGLADDGSIATPPFSQPDAVGWFNQGPKPGADKGKVVLTAHTFHAGKALGNKLFEKDHGLKPGALITLRDAQGKVQCFRFTTAQKIAVKDYDPDSTAVYDNLGDPMLAIVICWDYEPATKFWASRIVFYDQTGTTRAPRGLRCSI